jgi:hypothetical protein
VGVLPPGLAVAVEAVAVSSNSILFMNGDSIEFMDGDEIVFVS